MLRGDQPSMKSRTVLESIMCRVFYSWDHLQLASNAVSLRITPRNLWPGAWRQILTALHLSSAARSKTPSTNLYTPLGMHTRLLLEPFQALKGFGSASDSRTIILCSPENCEYYFHPYKFIPKEIPKTI